MPLSHAFVEQLIGTVRRVYLDRTLFLTTADLETKLFDSSITVMAIERMPGCKAACQSRVLTHLRPQ